MDEEETGGGVVIRALVWTAALVFIGLSVAIAFGPG
jgi:hypothetical protein